MTTKKKWYHRALFPGSRSALLLVSLFLLLAIYPQFERKAEFNTDHYLARIVLYICFTLILLGSAWLVHDRPRTFILACVLAVPCVTLGWLDHVLTLPPWVRGIVSLLFAVTSLYVVLSQLGFILRAKKVDADLLCRAVAVYLMLGVAWMAMYGVVDLFVPGSFQADPNALHGVGGQPGYSDLMYYSFSTISTLGIGDIAPVSPFARSLTVLECVIGPLYLAVLLARLVALYGREK